MPASLHGIPGSAARRGLGGTTLSTCRRACRETVIRAAILGRNLRELQNLLES